MSQTGLRDSLHNAFKPWQTGIDLHPSRTAFVPRTTPKGTMTCMASLPARRITQNPLKSVKFPPPPFPQPGNFLLTRLRNKKGALGGAAGAPQGLVPVLPGAGEASPSWAARAGLAGLGGQRLLTCLMVRFPSSIQPARGCSHCAAPGSAQIHQVSHRKQVFPPLLLPDFFFLLLIFSPPFLSFAGGGRDSS